MRMPQTSVALEIAAGQSVEQTFARPERLFDIFQVFVTVPGRPHSSFVIVDREN